MYLDPYGTHDLMEQQEHSQAEAAQEAQRQEEALRTALEAKRQERLTQEAYGGLGKQERAEFERRTDQASTVARLAEQARAEVAKKYQADNQAITDKEFAAWRAAHPKPSTLELHNAQKQINANAQARMEARQTGQGNKELAAETIDDPIQRQILSLDADEAAVFSRLLNEQPSPMDHIQAVISTHGQGEHEKLQAELRPRYDAEMRQAQGIHWKTTVQLKYRKLGLDV